MTTTPYAQPTAPADPRALARLLLAAVLLTIPAYCLFQALEILFYLFGDRPSQSEQAQAARWLTAAVWTALGASAGGLAVSTGRRGATWGFGITTALSLALMVALAPVIADLRTA